MASPLVRLSTAKMRSKLSTAQRYMITTKRKAKLTVAVKVPIVEERGARVLLHHAIRRARAHEGGQGERQSAQRLREDHFRRGVLSRREEKRVWAMEVGIGRLDEAVTSGDILYSTCSEFKDRL